MNKSYEVYNGTSGQSFGFFSGTSAGDAILACCREAGYGSTADLGGDLRASRIVAVAAAPYEDADDSLQAAAEAYAETHGLQGWDLSPRWANGPRDSLRDTIILSIPDNA